MICRDVLNRDGKGVPSRLSNNLKNKYRVILCFLDKISIKKLFKRRRKMETQNLFFKYLILLVVLALIGCSEKEVKVQYQPEEKDIALVSPNPPLEEMVGVSPCIFTGTVVGIRYGKHESSYYPYTFVTFKDIKFIKKTDEVPLDKDGTFEISYIGGILDDNSILELSGMPHFDLGNRYLIFLRGGGWRLSPIPGIDKGLFLLRGRVDGDPLLLDPSGTPIYRFENGYRVFSTKKDSEIEMKERMEDFKTEDMSLERARELGIIQEKPLEPEAVDKIEAEMKEKERELDEKKIVKEADQANQIVIMWPKVMRLSKLTGEVEELSKETQEKYKQFERLFFAPVPFTDRGQFKPVLPSKTK
jgi:DNA-binding transcriptional MerR regulator